MGLLRNRRLTDEQRRRLPPGQHLVHDFPVLQAGSIPYTEAPLDWDFRVTGLVERPERWSFDEFRALPTISITCDIHCVTSWTKLDTLWEGAPMSWLLDRVRPLPEVTHVVALAEEGYTANLPIERLMAPDALLAYRYDGRELDPEHGAPLRLLVPSLYFWKSAKWLRGLEFLAADRPGFWERLGYSNTADPTREERYAF
jgi:DMSO/TMAO reductase YedYZ molybdopterin-dependent catalytic subunit